MLVIRWCRHGAVAEVSSRCPTAPQPVLSDTQCSQMHHGLEKGLIRIRVATAFEHWQLKARLQAGEVNHWPVQGFGDLGEGVHTEQGL